MKNKSRVIDYFQNSVSQNPKKIAVIHGEQNITFEDLSFKSKEIAAAILSKTKSYNNPIAIFISKSINNVACVLGISYSRNIYMNLDTKLPLDRIKAILDNVQPPIILTDTEHSSIFKNSYFNNFHIINVENPFLDNLPLEKLLSIPDTIDTDPYCIINTSGSTGTPKAVVLNNLSFLDFANWSINKFNILQDEIIGSLSPPSFDIFSYEILLLIFRSSTLVLLEEADAAFPLKLIRTLKTMNVTFIFWVPTIMVNIANFDLLKDVSLPNLKKIFFAGEVFPTAKFNYWYDKFPSTLFVNLYGPIEITLDCSYFIIDSKINDCEPIPIGYPCENSDILVLDNEGNLVKNGEIGELCVRGSSLALGYYNDFQRTYASFTQNPLNTKYPELIYKTGDLVYYNNKNQLIYKGRKDNLIKHLGYRIELGEIEHVVVNDLKICFNACVLYNEKLKEITLFYEHESVLEPKSFIEKLNKKIPRYMIPRKYIKIEALPMNNNGKVDRIELGKFLTLSHKTS